jgi:hypothetical protein
MVDEQTKIWAAGAFDGEGCVIIQQFTTVDGYGGGYDTVVHISNTDPRLVVPFHVNWGGKVDIKEDDNPDHRTAYYVLWNVKSEAKKLLTDLIDYLVIKKEAAALVLEGIDVHAKNGGMSSNMALLYMIGLEQGLWGSKLRNKDFARQHYDVRPLPEKQIAADYLLSAVSLQGPKHGKKRVLDLDTGVEYSSMYRCGKALVGEFNNRREYDPDTGAHKGYVIRTHGNPWRTIYGICPERFVLIDG